MGDELMTREEFAGITATLTTTMKALLDQMVAWTAKVYNNNANNNNRNNPNRGGEPIPVIRVCNNIPTIVTYRKSKYANESDLEYYERKYYTKLKDDYYQFEIYDSVYRCPFCYNKDYSLTGLLRHAFRIAGNSCSRKMVKDIARHSVLITYILRILTTLKEEIDVAQTTEAFSTSVSTNASSCEESLVMAATIESKDGDRFQEVGCRTSDTISNEHHMKVAAEAMAKITESAAGCSQLQGDVENKVLGGSSLSTKKHSISVPVYVDELVKVESVSETLSTEIVLEIALHVNQARLEGLVVHSVAEPRVSWIKPVEKHSVTEPVVSIEEKLNVQNLNDAKEGTHPVQCRVVTMPEIVISGSYANKSRPVEYNQVAHSPVLGSPGTNPQSKNENHLKNDAILSSISKPVGFGHVQDSSNSLFSNQDPWIIHDNGVEQKFEGQLNDGLYQTFKQNFTLKEVRYTKEDQELRAVAESSAASVGFQSRSLPTKPKPSVISSSDIAKLCVPAPAPKPPDPWFSTTTGKSYIVKEITTTDFSLCIEDLVPVAIRKYLKAMISTMRHSQTIASVPVSSSDNVLERMFALFMEQRSLWPEICSLHEIGDPGTSESIMYRYLFIEPTILLDPPLDAEIMTEEIFGPLLPVITENESTVDVNPPESGAIIIQASIRGYLIRRALLKSKNVVKLQAVVRGHLVRRHVVGASRCIQAITEMQAPFSAPNHNSTMGLGVNIARMKGEKFKEDDWGFTEQSSFVKDVIRSQNLNESQQEAISSCVSMMNCYHANVKLIWGPTGTGKTKTVAWENSLDDCKKESIPACFEPSNSEIDHFLRMLSLLSSSNLLPELDDRSHPMGLVQLNAMRLADIFSDNSNFRSYMILCFTDIIPSTARDNYKLVETLVAHISDITEEHLVLYAQMANILHVILQWPEINIKEIAEFFSKFACNAHTICDSELRPLGTGLYHIVSIINHSSLPDSMLVFEGRVAVRALQHVHKGTEVLKSVKLEYWREALAYCKLTIPIYQRVYPAVHPLLGLQYYTCGKLEWYLGDTEEAIKSLTKAVDILRITHGTKTPLVKELLMMLEEARAEASYKLSSKEE